MCRQTLCKRASSYRCMSLILFHIQIDDLLVNLSFSGVGLSGVTLVLILLVRYGFYADEIVFLASAPSAMHNASYVR
jgi:hypothetical protein